MLFALLRLPTHPSCTRTIVMHGRCMRCIGLPRRAGHGLCLGPRRPAALQLHCACLCCLGRGCEPPTCPVHARWWRQFSAPNNLPRYRQTSLFYSPCNDAIVSYLQLLGLQQLLSVWLSSLPRHLLVGPSLLLVLLRRPRPPSQPPLRRLLSFSRPWALPGLWGQQLLLSCWAWARAVPMRKRHRRPSSPCSGTKPAACSGIAQ